MYLIFSTEEIILELLLFHIIGTYLTLITYYDMFHSHVYLRILLICTVFSITENKKKSIFNNRTFKLTKINNDLRYRNKMYVIKKN